MRTSHKKMQQMINDAKSKVTDEELFRSPAFAAYLTDIAETVTKRYRKGIKVLTFFETDPSAMLACTDNQTITINTGNYITSSFPSRALKVDSLIGLNAHEIGHILYTNFKTADLYFTALKNGHLYPDFIDELEADEIVVWQEIQDFLSSGTEIQKKAIFHAAKHVLNILEDAYIEWRVCLAFPGSFASGITLNNLRFTELVPTIDEQLNTGDYKFSIFTNLLVQYCLSGDFNNRDGYDGEIMDRFMSMLQLFDAAIYDEDMKQRCMVTNKVLLCVWDYIKEMIKDVSDQQDRTKADEKVIEGYLTERLKQQIKNTSTDPIGHTESIESLTESKEHHEINEPFQIVSADELGRMKRKETDSFDEGVSGGISHNKDYQGVRYAYAADDLERILTSIASEKVSNQLSDVLSDELQAQANSIKLGNHHSGVHIDVNRMREVDAFYISRYEEIAPALLGISKQMQKRLNRLLKEGAFEQKQNGLIFGRRVDNRSLMNRDGRYFSNKHLPAAKKELAVALLIDESGSMASADRVTYARAAAIIAYDFCRAMDIPLMIVGHTEKSDVQLYVYTDFDSKDPKDRFRLMDISARSYNRDGAAVRYVAERLSKQPERYKLLMLISDGQPSGKGGYCGTAAEDDLRGIKKEYTNKGITFVAAAIGSDKENIERIYGNSFIDISDLSQLPYLLVKKIDKTMRG